MHLQRITVVLPRLPHSLHFSFNTWYSIPGIALSQQLRIEHFTANNKNISKTQRRELHTLLNQGATEFKAQ